MILKRLRFLKEFFSFFFLLFRTSTTFKKLSESKWILRLASRRIMPKVLGLSWRNFLFAGLSSRSYFWHDNRCMCNTWSIQARRMSSGEVSKIWLSELFFRRVSLFSPSVSNREYCHQNEPKSALLMNVENSKHVLFWRIFWQEKAIFFLSWMSRQYSVFRTQILFAYF